MRRLGFGSLPKPAMQLLVFLTFVVFLPAAGGAQERAPIRFGVLSIAQPARIYAAWAPFAEYLSAQLERPVEIVVPRSFVRMAEAIEAGDVDFFYVNSHVFYRLNRSGKAVALAQMINLDGKPTSRSDIFVRADSKIRALSQLRGKTVAFVSPVGAGGYLAPRAYFYSQGVETKAETTEKFTKNLSNSIYGVLLGDIAAGSMCGIN